MNRHHMFSLSERSREVWDSENRKYPHKPSGSKLSDFWKGEEEFAFRILQAMESTYCIWWLQDQKVRCFLLVSRRSAYPPSALKWDSFLETDFL